MVATLGGPVDFPWPYDADAARLASGEVHIVFAGAREVPVGGGPAVRHWWAMPDGEGNEETLLGRTRGFRMDVSSDGATVATRLNEESVGFIHWTQGGAFQTDVLPGHAVGAVVPVGPIGYACAGVGNSVVLLERAWGEGQGRWMPDPIPKLVPLAGLLARCMMSLEDQTPVVAFQAGLETDIWRRSDAGWDSTSIPLRRWSLLEAGRAAGLPVIFGDGGEGTVNGSGTNAWFWTPTTRDAVGPWAMSHETWADRPVLLDHADRVAAASPFWGAPFVYRFPGPGGSDRLDDARLRLGVAVAEWDLPADALPGQRGAQGGAAVEWG